MKIEFSGDLLNALEKVVTGIKSLMNLPENERNKYYQTMDDTYKLIDTTLVMVIIRLGDILEFQSDEFLIEVTRLSNYDDWYRAERELRLCRQLRRVRNDTERIRYQLPGKIAVTDWDSLLKEMQNLLTNEDELAFFLSSKFFELSDFAKTVLRNAQPEKAIRDRVEAFRNSLNAERQRLMRQELKLYELM